MYLQYMAQNKMHSTGVMICFEQKKQSFSKIRSEDGYRGSDSEVTWKLLRWLTGMMSSFYIITEENERKFWPGLLRRTWYSVKVQFSSVQLLSRVWLFATPWITPSQASLSITNSRSSLRLTSIESVMPSSHLIFCRPLLLLPPIPPSIRVFSNESTLRMRWSKYWSFSFSIIPSKEIPGLISLRMDW